MRYDHNVSTPSAQTRRGPEPPDISEKGGMKDGQPQRSDARLFMQFLAFGGCPAVRPLAAALATRLAEAGRPAEGLDAGGGGGATTTGGGSVNAATAEAEVDAAAAALPSNM